MYRKRALRRNWKKRRDEATRQRYLSGKQVGWGRFIEVVANESEPGSITLRLRPKEDAGWLEVSLAAGDVEGLMVELQEAGAKAQRLLEIYMNEHMDELVREKEEKD